MWNIFGSSVNIVIYKGFFAYSSIVIILDLDRNFHDKLCLKQNIPLLRCPNSELKTGKNVLKKKNTLIKGLNQNREFAMHKLLCLIKIVY